MCETSASVEYFLDGCLGKSVCALSFMVSIACPEGKKWKWSGHTHTETSRTRCVWGNTVVPELPSPPQRARPFHSHAIQTPASPFFIAKGVQTQASPFHLSRGDHLGFFGWTICSSLSSSSFECGWTARSADSLVQHSWFRHWHRTPSRFTATGFLIHSSCPIAMDSWKFVLEIHWTWSELYGSLFDIGRVFFWKERGIGRFSWALQDPARNHPPGIVPTCLFPTFVGSGLSWLYCMWRMEAIGRRWSLIVSLLGGRELQCWSAGR